jgi:epoxide hydrolase-like predicted phosphatase
MIKAIIFDFGRVISAQKPPSLFRSYESDLGLELGTINSLMFTSKAWQEALVGGKTVEEFWQEIGAELNLNTPAEIDAFSRRYQSDESINQPILHLLQELNGRYKLAVLSNSPAGLRQWLADWNLLDLFDTVFCSGDEGVVKPETAAFEIILQRLGVEPEEAVFIDDTDEHVVAARNMGLQGIPFTTAEALREELTRLLGRDF